jgi:predicted nucleotidyltransferase
MALPHWNPPLLGAGSPLAGQRALLARIEAVLRGDEQVMAAVVTGSLARGNADAFSDVDVTVLVSEAALAGFVEQWEHLLEGMSPTVFRRKFGNPAAPIITAITPEWRRFDLVIQPLGATDTRAFASGLLLFARDGVADRLQLSDDTRPETPDRLRFLVEEFLRVLGLLEVVVGRNEFLVGTDGVMLLRRLLIDLMLWERGATDRGGVKRLNPFLTQEQRLILEQLPPISPTRTSIIGGNVAIAKLFLPLARSMAARHGMKYPKEFERATLDHLRSKVGVVIDRRNP